jgi:D-amino-acid dehydrogenase
VVIGAGIVGLSSALYLQRDGHRVTILDPREPGTATSFGNAGGIVVSSCVPLGTPGVLRQVPGMLFDPKSALSVRWRYLPRAMPWLVDFVRASRPSRVEEISKALTALNAGATEAWRDLMRDCGSTDLIRQVGWLKVYETTAGFEKAAANRALERRRGHRIDELSVDELRQLEPNLAPIFRHASIDWECSFILEPIKVTTAMAATFIARGGRIERDSVMSLSRDTEGVRVSSEQGSRVVETAILAAGSWSRKFLSDLGVRPKLESERGYHLMLPTPERNVGRPVVNVERHFVLSPMQSGLRLASGEELAGLEAPPDFTRIKRLLPEAKRMLPGLDTEIVDSWLGRRPATPDSLPVIGKAPGLEGVICAFGHGHLGMTQGPVTGRIVADVVAGRDPQVALSHFSPTR